MATVTRTQNVSLDSWFAQISGDNYGAGKGTRFGVGKGTGAWSTWTNRFGIAIPRGTLFDSIPNAAAITAFNVKLRVSNSCYGIGGAVRFFLERGTVAFTENSYDAACGVTSSGSASSEFGIADSGNRTATDRGSYQGTPGNNDWITVNMLALGQWWFAHPEVTTLTLYGIASDGSTYDESTTSRRSMFYSRETSSVPYGELTFNDNQAPLIPTDLLPVADTTISSTAGTEATVSSRHTDPEANAATKYQAQWYPSSATDATPGTPTKDNTVTATTAHNAVRSHTFTGLPARTAGKWRMRFYDTQWGPWSLLQANTTAYKPSAVSLAAEPGTKTPRLYASISSADTADTISAAREVIYQDPAVGSTITKWDSGKVALGGTPTRSELTYAGTALEWGTQYRRQMQIWNRDDVASDLTANTYFTPLEAVGALISPSDTTAKIDSLTPTFTLSAPGAVNIDQARLYIDNEAGTLVYDSGVVAFASAANKAMVVPSGVLDWGQNPQVYGAVRVTGNANIGPTSEKKTVHINAKPGSPYPLSITHATAQFVQRADAVWVVDSATPIGVFPFRDVDRDLGYTDNPVRRSVEVRTLADAHFAASPYTITSGITDNFTFPTLTVETTYKARANFDDNANVRSDWSEYVFVKNSAKPTLSSVTPANAASVTDPTPAFAWVYASSGGKAQASYRLIASVGETIVYDTGLVLGTAATAEIPAFVLDNLVTVAWTLTVYDTDGLYATVSRTFDTAFAAPAALTGLTITPDDATKSLIVEFDESLLTVGEFAAYYIYAKTEGGQFRLVTTLTTKTDTSLYFRAAAHNRETIIRVTQTNGWAESDPVEASATLELENDWVMTDSIVMQLLDAKGPPERQPVTREEFAPPGRTDKIVLTWSYSGFEGSLTVHVTSLTDLEQLQAWGRAGTVVLLKFRDGRVRYAILTVGDSINVVESLYQAGVTYIEAAPASTNF